MTAKTDVYIYGRNGGMTEKEYYDLHKQMAAADARGDEEEYDRISRMIPITADVAMAFKTVYGRDFIISNGFDVTEANMKFGEGWLDETGPENTGTAGTETITAGTQESGRGIR